jgi:hypothetical protein
MASTPLLPEAAEGTSRWRGKLDRYFARCSEAACRVQAKPLRLPRWRKAGVYLDKKWYCSVSCLLPALERAVKELLPDDKPAVERGHRVPIGLLLLQRGVITHEQLRQALALQRKRGEGRLGEWLRWMGVATEADITRALATQWGCPVFPLERDQGYRQCAGLVPLSISELYGLLPVFCSEDRSLLYVAFTSGVDHALLYGIERMLGCRTLPCIVNTSAYRAALDDLQSRTELKETNFNSVGSSFEIAHAACSFSERLHAQALQLAVVGGSLWIRFLNSAGPFDLLFHLTVQRVRGRAASYTGFP